MFSDRADHDSTTCLLFFSKPALEYALETFSMTKNSYKMKSNNQNLPDNKP